MADINFGQTRMGQEFYEGTMKNINKNLERIATALEAIAAGQVEGKETLDNINETLKYLK